MKTCYITKNFGHTALEVIAKANDIVEDYAAQGLDLTLRQLYYQFVATDGFPDEWLVRLPGGQMTKNHERNYKKLGKLINDARLAGHIDWDSIEDRTREVLRWQTDTHPQNALNRAIRSFRLNPWADQETYVEIWVEKEALAGVFETVSRKWLCPMFCCRGYHSASSAYKAAERMRDKRLDEKRVTILHFGDHDPSGLDMTRDVEERFSIFDGGDAEDPYGVFSDNPVTVKRCALNMDQVLEFNPPPSPAKITDSRASKYIEEFGEDSWELDAMSPKKLQDLANAEVGKLIDQDNWDATKEREEEDTEKLRSLSKYL